MRRPVLTISIAAVLIAFFSVPIAFIIYGGVGALLFGLAIVGGMIFLQLPLFIVLKRWNVLPTSQRERIDDQP